jgi:hypothetical protein
MDAEHSHPPARIVVERYEVDLRLSQLGVSRAPFVKAALEGDLQRRLCTSDDFYATAGYSGWARAFRVTRQECRELHHWHNGSFLRIPVTFNESDTIAIAVSPGDERTGLPGDDPSTNAKGPWTVAAVEESTAQGTLDLDGSEEMGVDLWYLLTYSSEEDGVRIELSNPLLTDERQRISIWRERIIIGRTDPDTNVQAAAPVVPSPITINVPRKSA